MKTQLNPIAQPPPNVVRLLLLNDPAYSAWCEQSQAENERNFDEWLASPDGQTWLESEIEYDEERRCLSIWKGW